MKTRLSLITLVILLLAVAALPVAPVVGQDGDVEAQCERLRVALACNCLVIVTPDTVIYMRPLTDEERASYLALYDELGCAAFEPTEPEPEQEQEANPKPKRTAVPQVPPEGPPAPLAATPRRRARTDRTAGPLSGGALENNNAPPAGCRTGKSSTEIPAEE